MEYYKTNAIYQALNQYQRHNFLWLSQNAWMLLYGDKFSSIKLFAFIKGVSFEQAKENNHKNQKILENFYLLSLQANIPFIEIIFDDSADSIQTVQVRTSPEKEFTEISLNELRNCFKKIGLEVLSGECTKSINDKTSSAYHNWQRNNLGNITVSDIDLIRFEDDKITEIIELKRSYIALNSWRPFTDDYANFNLISDMCEKSGISRFLIVYNQRNKNPWHDDPSMVSIFSYDKNNKVSKLATVPLKDFIENRF